MGIVSTNVLVGGNGSGSSGANGADLPTRLKSLSANGGNKFVTLTLGYENTNFVTGVQVNYKVGGYPTSPTDGQSITISGAATSIKITSLTNQLIYYFRVFLYREVDNTKYYQTDITNARISAKPRAVEITGMTPDIEGDGFMVFTKSGKFNMSAPVGTRIVIGGGGDGGYSGYGNTYEDEEEGDTYGESIQGSVGQISTLKIGSTTYRSDRTNSRNIITTKAGKVGGGGTGGTGGKGSNGSGGTMARGHSGANGGNGGSGGLPNGSGGIGGEGGNGGSSKKIGYGGSGGTGGTGGASGNGTSGFSGSKGTGGSSTTGQGGSGGSGGAGAIGDSTGMYSYGGRGGNGHDGNGDSSLISGQGCEGGRGGDGGFVTEVILQGDISNATCTLTIGTKGIGRVPDGNYSEGERGYDGGNGVLIIEWDT